MSQVVVLFLLLSIVNLISAQSGICDPLVPQNCLLPFPNDFFTRLDPNTPTGLRVAFNDAAAPKDRQGDGFSFNSWTRLDGWSISSTLIAFFPNVSVENSNLPGWQDPSPSLRDDCPTVVLDTVTGSRLDHFAELDYTTPTATERAFMIWPLKQFTESRRYIVAIRNLRTITNELVQPSFAFAALRDGIPTSDPDIENRRKHFEDIFVFLEGRGISRRTLQLAWDFTVGSEKYTTQGLFFMRDDANKRIPAGGPSYSLVEVQDNYSDKIFRRIAGEFTMPHYLTRGARPGSELVVDEQGIPIYQGEVAVPFTVAIPFKCTTTGAKCPILVYGHGLTGTQGQVLSGTQQNFAEKYGYILCGVDLWGMSSPDVPSIAVVLLTDFGRINIIPDRSHQGLLNQLFLTKLLGGNFANDNVFNFGGQSVVDTSSKYYWGISQGGILGAVHLAVSDDVNKAHLGVPGAPYPLMLARSVDFNVYFSVLKARYNDPIDRILLLSLLGLLWDRAEPSGYLAVAAKNPNKRALIDYANGDAQVSFLAAYFMGRSLNARIFKGNVHCLNETTPIYGFEEVSTGSTTQGSIVIGFEYEGIPCGPVENIPPNKETDTHGRPRNDERNFLNMDSFFRTGEILDICEGKGCFVPN